MHTYLVSTVTYNYSVTNIWGPQHSPEYDLEISDLCKDLLFQEMTYCGRDMSYQASRGGPSEAIIERKETGGTCAGSPG